MLTEKLKNLKWLHGNKMSEIFSATICQHPFAKSAERKAVISFYVINKKVT